MRWPHVTREPAPTEEDRIAARRRLAAISSRSAGAPKTGWVPQVPVGLDSGERESPRSGSASVDRLPLALRAAVELLPATVRGGRVGLEGGHAVVIVLVVLLGVAIGALLLGLGRPRVEPVGTGVSATVVATGTPASGLPDSQPGDSHPSGQAQMVVHVAGKVKTPGIVRLPSGSRVLDAVEAAGGPLQGVDLTGLNLARLITDGEQILVGVPPPAGADAAPSGGSAGVGLVNLNTSSAEQLEALPGIGPALAGRILAWRDQHGQFGSVEELQEVSGIGPAIFAELADLVTV